ncbi:MAG: NAD(P)H-hydrate dehydratase [Abditibacteriaceae bacterium]
MNVYTVAQMRAYDQAAIESGIPSMVLMEHSALRVVEFLEYQFAPLRGKHIAIFCGKGNNGGDGLACARLLHQAGFLDVTVFLAFSPDEFKGDAKAQYEIIKGMPKDQNIVMFDLTKQSAELLWLRYDIMLDALLGTGFQGDPRGDGLLFGLDLLKFARPLSETTCVAIDIPSGLNSDDGSASEECVSAEFTVTIGGLKKGMLTSQASEFRGETWIGSIGADSVLEPRDNTGLQTIDARFVQACLPHWTDRSVNSDKRAAGKVLLCGGSLGMSGAPVLSATAALRSGAGLTIAALPKQIIPIFASALAESTSLPLPDDENGRLTLDALPLMQNWWNENKGVIALGPGISRSDKTMELVQQIAQECPLPLIVDADALHALAPIADSLKSRKAPLILTPHGGEIAALLGISPKDLPEDRIETAQRCAGKYNAIVVYKGHYSIVAAPQVDSVEGEFDKDIYKSTFINLTGNPGMASGGSGDVLTGIVAGMLAQNQTENPFLSVLMSVYLHGLAGDVAFEKHGNGLLASDIANAIPEAMHRAATPKLDEINNRLFKLE